MNERRRDARDLRLLELTDYPPNGWGLSFAESARILEREFPDFGPYSRNAAIGQSTRIRKALAESEAA